MTLFYLGSWLLTILTGISIVLMYRAHPFVLVKPSFIVAVFLFLQIQISSAINAEWIESYLPNAWHYFVCTHLFPLAALMLSLFVQNQKSKSVYDRIRSVDWLHSLGMLQRPMLLCALSILLVVFWYLSTVSWTNTGLYALLYLSPAAAEAARERSMSLLNNPPLEYGYLIMSTSLAPILAIYLLAKTTRYFQQRKFPRMIASIASILLLAVSVSLYGARGAMAICILTALLAAYLGWNKKMGFKTILVLGFLSLLGPTLMTIFRENKETSMEILGQYYMNTVDRAFGRTIVPGVWHFDYVQRFGYFGISGLNNLASLFGMERSDVFNIVGRFYTGHRWLTITANTTFVNAYYACFGIFGFFLCLALLALLDSVVVLYNNLRTPFLLICVATSQIAISRLSTTSFTTIFITGGLIPILFICFALSAIFSGSSVFIWQRRSFEPAT